MSPPDTAALDAEQALYGAAKSLDLELSAEQAQQLLSYLDLLSKWNRVYNLSAVRDPAAMLVQHVVDSLAVVGPLRRQTRQRLATSVLDVGSGAGLPGLVLAVMNPDMQVTCIDSVGKKAAFVREAAGALGLRNLHSVHGRVEKLQTPEPFDIVTARAFASLADLVSLTREVSGSETVWMALKGRVPEEEIATLPSGFAVFHVERLVVPALGAERCLIWIRRSP